MHAVGVSNGAARVQAGVARPASPSFPPMQGTQSARVSAAFSKSTRGSAEDKVLLLGVTGITGRWDGGAAALLESACIAVGHSATSILVVFDSAHAHPLVHAALSKACAGT